VAEVVESHLYGVGRFDCAGDCDLSAEGLHEGGVAVELLHLDGFDCVELVVFVVFYFVDFAVAALAEEGF
jgi:hypothetical protein